ncbi:putative RNA-directed DNA polymerase from transposon BS [Trichonephila clavipes]|nr:putative RNA-directed DNA polymerase from transposon BS [Trichonephila clavipes]
MLTLRYFPMSWKTAVVIPILKPDKNSALAESYRPISLLPVLSKLAEKVILARLNDHLERENILIPEQHGFRPRLSTSHQLLRVVEFIKEGNKTKMNARPRSSLIFKKPLIEYGILAYSLN